MGSAFSSSAAVSKLSRRSLLKMGVAGGVGIGLSGLVAARASASDSQSTFAYMSTSTADTDVAWFKAVTAAMEKDHPWTVRAQQLEADRAFYPQVQIMVSTGKFVDVLPDVDIATFQGLALQGLLATTDEIHKTLGPKFFTSASMDWVTIDGKTYGFPVRANGFVIWYRTDLAEKAGLSVPKSWDELENFMKELTGKNVYGNGLPYGVNTATSGAFYSFLRARGGFITDPDLKNTFNSDATVATMEYLAKIAKYAPPGNLNYGYAEILQNFVQGKTATCYYSGRVMQRIHTDNPSLDGKFSAFQVPAYDGGAYQPSYGSGAVCCILKKAPNPEAAKVWVTDYQFHAPYYLDALLGAPGNDYPVVNLDATEQARYNADPILKLNAETVAKVTVPAAGMSAAPSRETARHQINPHGGDIISSPIIPTALQAVVTGTSAKDAVANASARIDDILAS